MLLSCTSLAFSTVGSAQVACRHKPRLVRVADRAMRCRHLQPPDLDVSVLVGERALHNLVVKLWWPVGLVRFKIGKLHRRAFPPSYGHSFKSPGPWRAARAAARSSVAAAVLAPRCRRRFATWWEACDTDLVGGFSKPFERFWRPTAEARCSTSYEQLRHLNHRNSSTQGFADPGALFLGCKARWRQTPKHETLLQMRPCTSGSYVMDVGRSLYGTAAALGFGALVRSPCLALAGGGPCSKSLALYSRPPC